MAIMRLWYSRNLSSILSKSTIQRYIMIYHQLRDNFIDVVVSSNRQFSDITEMAKYWAENNYVGGNIRWDDLGPETQQTWIDAATKLSVGGF